MGFAPAPWAPLSPPPHLEMGWRRRAPVVVALAVLPAAAAQGFEGFVNDDQCPPLLIEATAEAVDAACCSPASACADGVPRSCGPNCALAMAELKWGLCWSKFVALTDTADGHEADGVSEAMDGLWSTCLALPPAWVQSAVEGACPGMPPINWDDPPAIGSSGGATSTVPTHTRGAHRRMQANSLSSEQQNEEMLFVSVSCDRGDTTAVVAYPCDPCQLPPMGSYPAWDSERDSPAGAAVLNSEGKGFTLYQLTVPSSFFSDDKDSNTEKYASLCAQANLHTVTTGDSSWGAPTAECADYGCIAISPAASTDAPHWVMRATGWDSCVTHGVRQSNPVNERDPYYGTGGWDRVVHPICGLEHV